MLKIAVNPDFEAACINIFNIIGVPYEIKLSSRNEFKIWGRKIELSDSIRIFKNKFCRDEESLLKDKYGRALPPKKRIVYPELDKILQDIFNKIKLKAYESDMPVIQKWFWPDRRKFAVCITHDIDKIRPTLADQKNRLKYLLHKERKKIIYFIKEFVTKRNPWDPNKIANYDLQNGVKSSFYFRADKETYNLEKPVNKKLVNKLIFKGFEIGLHGSFNSYNNEELLAEEKKLIEKQFGKIQGVRQHYLRFDTPTTWVKQKSAGLLYDTTYGFAQTIGYRSGISFPFYPFDETNKIINILEIPLTIMDWSLIGYLKLTLKEAMEIIKKLSAYIIDNNSLITILWHNEYFEELVHHELKRLYEEIICNFKLYNPWFCSGSMLYDWWIKRGRQNIEANYSDSKLSIEFDKNAGGALKICLPRNWQKGENNCMWIDTSIEKYVEVDKHIS